MTKKKYQHPLEIEYQRMKREEARIARKLEIAQYLIDNPSLGVRKIAKEFAIGKSTVHQDLIDLKKLGDDCDDLYVQCRNILMKHRSR